MCPSEHLSHIALDPFPRNPGIKQGVGGSGGPGWGLVRNGSETPALHIIQAMAGDDNPPSTAACSASL